MSRGLIHIYAGDGKGKTSAAVGLGVRAAGSGLRVFMIEFMKSGGSGEQDFVKKAGQGFEIVTAAESVKFLRDMTEDEKEAALMANTETFSKAADRAARGEIDMLILDEIFFSLNFGLIDKAAVWKFVTGKPEALELVLTGRDPGPEFLEAADYISEIKKIKHPYDRGVKARKGIEY